MLALFYLFVATILGDMICRRFLFFTSVAHRLAAAFLVGILFSACFNYLFALLFSGTAQPLLWGNVVFLAVSICLAIVLTIFFSEPSKSGDKSFREDPQGWKWDVACILLSVLFGYWLFVSTVTYADGAFNISIKSWSDFGANLSLTQSMALGNNFPTVHPFFPSETIRYHFLFWFLTANLSSLGMNSVFALNLLSLLSLTAMLILLMTFAKILFTSSAVARIAVLLFFLASSSLSYIPFLRSQPSVSTAIATIFGLKDYVKSGYPYRGDDWGALSVVVYANQRQLISAVGIVLLVLIYLVGFYRRKGVITAPDFINQVDADRSEAEELESIATPKSNLREYSAFVFCGILIGALPYWNTALFIAASLIIGTLFLLFPYRRQLLLMIITTIVIGLPQMLLLISGTAPADSFSFFKWGYIISDPTLSKTIEYLFWTFGIKLFLFGIAFWLVPKMHRRLLVALTVPAVIVFIFQLSTDVFNNHKLLNIWLTLTSVYVAFVIWAIGRHGIANRIIAVVLMAVMCLGAVIDLFPIKNDIYTKVQFENDRLTGWLTANTEPSDIFLTDTLLSHPILMSGRKVFLGNTLFAWTAGYAVKEREKQHRLMFQTNSAEALIPLLERNNIAYVAIDNGVRTNEFTKKLDESVFRDNFELAFDDSENKYGNLKIYKIGPPTGSTQTDVP